MIWLEHYFWWSFVIVPLWVLAGLWWHQDKFAQDLVDDGDLPDYLQPWVLLGMYVFTVVVFTLLAPLSLVALAAGTIYDKFQKQDSTD